MTVLGVDPASRYMAITPAAKAVAGEVPLTATRPVSEVWDAQVTLSPGAYRSTQDP